MGFWREVFSEQVGDKQLGSYSRVASGVLVVATLLWVTWLVVHKMMSDWYGPSMFLSVGVGVHYGTNRATDIFNGLQGLFAKKP